MFFNDKLTEIMSSPLVTICIPTYNRSKELSQQLDRLAPQLRRADVELVVVDNHSIDDTASIFAHFNDLYPDIKATLIRNKSNIGLGANILRGLESSSGAWTWLLSDDDPVCIDGVETIINTVKNQRSETSFIKLIQESDQELFPPLRYIECPKTFAEVFADANRFGILLFISTCVVRNKSAERHMNSAYHWCYSMGPHLVFAMKCIHEGEVICLERKTVVEWGKPDENASWNRWQLKMGLLTLGEIKGCESLLQTMYPAIVRSWLGKHPITSIPGIIFNSGDREVAFWKAYFLRMASGAPIMIMLYIQFWVIIASMPFAANSLKALIRLFKKGRIDSLGYDRS